MKSDSNAGQMPTEWWMRAPSWGHCASTARMREVPTTHVAYVHPSDNSDHTKPAGAATSRDTEGMTGCSGGFHSVLSRRTSLKKVLSCPLGLGLLVQEGQLAVVELVEPSSQSMSSSLTCPAPPGKWMRSTPAVPPGSWSLTVAGVPSCGRTQEGIWLWSVVVALRSVFSSIQEGRRAGLLPSTQARPRCNLAEIRAQELPVTRVR